MAKIKVELFAMRRQMAEERKFQDEYAKLNDRRRRSEELAQIQEKLASGSVALGLHDEDAGRKLLTSKGWRPKFGNSSPRPTPASVVTNDARDRVPNSHVIAPQIDVASIPGVWSIARVKCREEKAVAGRLAACGVGVYLPTVVESRRVRRTINGVERVRRERVELAAFPAYVFAAYETDAARDALYDGRGVFEVIRVADQARLVRDLAGVQRLLAVNPELRPTDTTWIVPGAIARVRSGAFEGFVGEVCVRRGHKVFLVGIKMPDGSRVGFELQVADHELEIPGLAA